MNSKKIVLFLCVVLLLMLVAVNLSNLIEYTAVAKSYFDRTNIPAQVQITANVLNVRTGPATYFTKIATVYKNQVVDCLGKLGSWYIVHLDNDMVGAVSDNFSKPYYPSNAAATQKPNPTVTPKPIKTQKPSSTPKPNTPPPTANPSAADSEVNKMLQLINNERAKVGSGPLALDSKTSEVAAVKAQDMVNNNYFSHTSPTYGSPFDMLKTFGVQYKSAGENLAGNSNVEKAHTALMNSEGHKKNILNSSFNYIGIGIANSSTYGKIYVQMFIGK